MRVEFPEFKRFCFCLPLRYGLIACGYVCLIPCLVSIYSQIGTVSELLNEPEYDSSIYYQCLFLTLMTLDAILTTVFVIGAHLKDVKLLRIYFIGNLCQGACFILAILCLACYFLYLTCYLYQFSMAGFHPKSITWSFLMILSSCFLQILFQGYAMLLLRSEIKKLESDYQFKFKNNVTDAECTLMREEDALDEGRGMEGTYQGSEDIHKRSPRDVEVTVTSHTEEEGEEI